jgi:flagellar hook-basal body protein
MGLFGAMTTAVGGLRAQAFALENVSGNIANSQTTGFKRVDTSFADLVPDSTPQLQLAGGVLARSRGTNNVQGDIQNASVNTFMAINGPGYFIVQKPSGFPDGTPVFTGVDLFSRRGDFQLDKDGFLVNGTGYYLKVLQVDGVTGNVTGSVPEVLQFSNDFLPAQPTSLIEYRANLATFPRTAQADPDVPGSDRLNTAAFAVDPTNAGTGTVIANDLPTFIAQSIAGGAVTMYDTVGSAVNIQLRWAKLADQIVNIQGSAIAADVAATGQGAAIPADTAAVAGSTTLGTYTPDVSQVNTSSVFGTPADITIGGYIVNGDTLTFDFGGGNTFTTGALDDTMSLTDLETAINNASDGAGFGDWVTATIAGGNQLVLTANDAAKTFTVTNNGTGTLSTAGDVPVTTPAENLLTQTVGLDGETLTITIGANATKTVVFGDDVGEIGSLAELLADLTGSGPAGGTVTVAADGSVEITAGNNTDSIVVGGTATAPQLATLGLASGTFDASNGTLTPLFGQTLSVVSGATTVNITFGTGVGEVSNRAQLMTTLASLGSLGGGDELTLTALNNVDDVTVTGTAAAALGFGGAAGLLEPTNPDIGALTGNLTVQLGAGAPFTVTFGTNDGANEVNNRQELAARLAVGAAATGLSLSVNGSGQIVIGNTGNETVDVGGTPATLAALGITAQTAQGSTTPTWELFYQENSTATGTGVAWRNAGATYTFDASGQMTSSTQVITLTGVTINGLPLGDITINHGDAGITQFSDVNGNAQVNLLRQNGYPAGNLQGISVNEKGRVIATYSNGRTLEMAEIVLASFNADNSLKRLDGGAFEATSESGQAQYGASGKIIAKSLEGSNTDIADEFTKLIVTQQAYAANTRIVTTSDQMLQETLNMVR